MGFFQSINLVIKYKPGEVKVIADVLSRSRGQQETESSLNILTKSSIVDSSGIRLWKKAQEEDPVYKDLIQ